MRFQQFLTCPPPGAVYPRLGGFCIITVWGRWWFLGGNAPSKWCRYGEGGFGEDARVSELRQHFPIAAFIPR